MADGCIIALERADEDYIDLYDRTKSISIQLIVKISRQISFALGHLHRKGFSHGDLKPD